MKYWILFLLLFSVIVASTSQFVTLYAGEEYSLGGDYIKIESFDINVSCSQSCSPSLDSEKVRLKFIDRSWKNLDIFLKNGVTYSLSEGQTQSTGTGKKINVVVIDEDKTCGQTCAGSFANARATFELINFTVEELPVCSQRNSTSCNSDADCTCESSGCFFGNKNYYKDCVEDKGHICPSFCNSKIAKCVSGSCVLADATPTPEITAIQSVTPAPTPQITQNTQTIATYIPTVTGPGIIEVNVSQQDNGIGKYLWIIIGIIALGVLIFLSTLLKKSI